MKRFLSLVLAAVLALCALPAMAESAAPTKLTVLTTSKDDLSADYSMKKVAEKCNVEFEWVYLVEDTAKEKFQIMVNANELPDIILRPDALAGDANQAYALGVDSVFLDLIPAMEKYAPDMMALYQGYTDVWNACVGPNGALYMLPRINEDRDFTSNGVRTYIDRTWLKNVDMEMPTTLDEFYNVLVAFKEKDANGNGDPNDEIPWTFDKGTNVMDGLVMTAFTEITQGDTRIIRDGKVQIAAMTEAYREALRFMNKCFSEGLIYAESFTQDSNTVWALNEKSADVNTLGVVTGGHRNCVCSWDSRRWESYDQIFVLFDENGETHPSVKLGNNFGRNVALNANITDEKLEAAMRVLEYIASEEGSFLVRVGELGYNVQPADEGGLAIGGEKAYYRKNTEEEDEKLVVNGKITMTNDWNWIMRLEQSYQQAAANANPGDDWTYVHITMENKYYHIYVKDIGLYWPTTMIMDAEGINEMALIQTEMKNYISSATTDFITGKRNVDTDWDAYLADLNKIQVEKFLTISQEQYDKGTAR